MKLLYLLACCVLLQACGGGTSSPENADPEHFAGGPSPAAPAPTPTPTPTQTETPAPAPAPAPAPTPAPAPAPAPDSGTANPDPGVPPAVCSVAGQRATLRDHMERQYFWYAQLAAADEQTTSMDGYFRSMLYQPTDRYSFSESTAAHNQLFVEGRRVGYGYALTWADAARTRLRVRNVEPLSPVARAGLVRGDTVVSIDGVGPAEIVAGALPIVNTAGVKRTFVVRDLAGAERTIVVFSEDFPLSPVAAKATFDVTRAGLPVKVGYLAYNQFVGYSLDELGSAFSQFNQAGVGELILDLRYNGGGSVAVARDLASMIGGSRAAGQPFAYLRFNDKQAANTINFRFNADAPPGEPMAPLAGLSRVIVIASGSTASASELVVNGLRPFMDVVLVGDTTYGKPYGFVPRSDCGITYNAVQFVSLNALGTADYTAGFAPNCPVPDDLDHALADTSERRLRAALDYVVTGSCPQAPLSLGAPKPRSPPEVFGESWPNRMFIEPQ